MSKVFSMLAWFLKPEMETVPDKCVNYIVYTYQSSLRKAAENFKCSDSAKHLMFLIQKLFS